VPEARTILSLVVTGEGLLYGITNNEKVFVFDADKRKIRKVFSLGFEEPREVSLQLGPDSRLYGLAKEALFQIDPGSDRVSLVMKPSVPVDSGMAMLGRKIYFGSDANLYEFELPLEPNHPVE
jgi:hypothetical protein